MTSSSATATFSIRTPRSACSAGRISPNRISAPREESSWPRRIRPNSRKRWRGLPACARKCPSGWRLFSAGPRNPFPFPTSFPRCRNFCFRQNPDNVSRAAETQMKLFVAIAGLFIAFVVLWEAFETIILPRRVTRPVRLVRIFYRVTWTIWAAINRSFRLNKMREAHLSYYGPLSLLGLFATWAFLLVLAFSMLHWAAGSALNSPGETATFRTDFYLSGTTFFTLGLGDVTPRTTMAKAITVIEGGTGFGFLGLMISYLPTLYGAF